MSGLAAAAKEKKTLVPHNGGHCRPLRSRRQTRGPKTSRAARVGARTEFGSRTTLAVAATRGRWLGVITTHLPNGRLGWVDRAESAFTRSRTRVSVAVDLSARRLVVRRGDRVVRRVPVAVGRSTSPTPTGRFAVTDKLSGPRYSAAYGCCILALSAHQPNLPAGWRGGDRIAVHGTNDPGSIGTAATAGTSAAASRSSASASGTCRAAACTTSRHTAGQSGSVRRRASVVYRGSSATHSTAPVAANSE